MAQLLVLLLAVSFRGCKRFIDFRNPGRICRDFFMAIITGQRKFNQQKKTALFEAVFFVYLLIKISEILHLSLSKP